MCTNIVNNSKIVLVSISNQWAFESGMSKDELRDRLLESVFQMEPEDFILVIEEIDGQEADHV